MLECHIPSIPVALSDSKEPGAAAGCAANTHPSAPLSSEEMLWLLAASASAFVAPLPTQSTPRRELAERSCAGIAKAAAERPPDASSTQDSLFGAGVRASRASDDPSAAGFRRRGQSTY